MSLGKRALKKKDLVFVHPDQLVDEGSHITHLVELPNKKQAYFKVLDPLNGYPEILAKISVGAAVCQALFLGCRTAIEHLVYNDEGTEIIGTVSENIDGWKSFNFANEPVPENQAEKERVIPSTETLIFHKTIELFFAKWVLGDDDSHAHNLSLDAIIDNDMFWAWFIWRIKPRPSIVTPMSGVTLTRNDFRAFPFVTESQAYYWPAYDSPGQYTLPCYIPGLPKYNAASKQVQKMASDAKAQQQKYAIALKFLLTYDPKLLRKRLEEEFGTENFNYTSLVKTDPILKDTFNQEFPDICNERTNVGSCVDFIMQLYQMHYDAMYRIFVFERGCADNGHGIPVPPTNKLLYCHPSLYTDVKDWAQEENRTIYNTTPELQYQEADIEKRYHQLWRDSFALHIKRLLNTSFNLVDDLIDANSSFILVSTLGKEPSEDTLNQALDLFNKRNWKWEDIKDSIPLKTSRITKEGIRNLVGFSNRFQDLIQTYFQKKAESLSLDDNDDFLRGMEQLYLEGQGFSLPQESLRVFHSIMEGLKTLILQFNFRRHIHSQDEEIQQAVVAFPEIISHKDPRIIEQFNQHIFDWADSLSASKFKEFIENALQTYNVTPNSISFFPSWLRPVKTYYHQREAPVRIYLNKSEGIPGNRRLAYILASGKETGALNTILIKMLGAQIRKEIPSLEEAWSKGCFNKDIALFTEQAVLTARKDISLMNLYSNKAVKYLYKTLFTWVKNMDKNVFTEIVDQSLVLYESKLAVPSFMHASRKKDVQSYYRVKSNEEALAHIFNKPGLAARTLFYKLIAKLKEAIREQPSNYADLGYELIKSYSPIVHEHILTDKNLQEQSSFYLKVQPKYPIEEEFCEITAADLVGLS